MISRLKLKLSDYLLSHICFLIFGILTITPFILISIFNHPAADDFCYYSKSQSLGFLEAQIYWYTEWTGRYFSSALLSLMPLGFKTFLFYKLVPVLLIAALFFSLYYLISLIFTNWKRKEIILLTVCIQSLFFFKMPMISQGLYWVAGAVTYQLANILAVILFCFVLKLIQTGKSKYLILSVLFAFFLIGSNETSMLIVVYLLVSAFVINFIKAKKINYLFLVLLVFSAIFSYIVITAPGNITREAFFPNKHQFGFSVINTIKAIIIYTISWLPITIVFTIIIFDFLKKHVQVSYNPVFDIHPLLAFKILCFILFAGFFPAFWSLGHLPPERTVNTIYFFFLLSFFYFFFSLNLYLQKNDIIFLTVSPWVKFFLGVIITINLLQRNNIRTAYSDLITSKARKYDLELKSRYITIKNTKGDTCFVPKLQNQPSTLFVDDITAETNDWRNQCYDAYWKAKTVIIKERINGY